MASPLSISTAQAIGLTGAAWLSGNIAALSLISVPALPQAESTASTIAKQWYKLYSLGAAQNPPIAAATASAFAFLAYSLRSLPGVSRLYGVAAVLTIGIVPWTILTMRETNAKLIAKARGEESGRKVVVVGDEEVEGLLRKWAALNGVRSLFPLIGAAAGWVAFLG